ncbi:MAG: GNAT family N-acetyltransferase [Gammaproteobacteria bacterium]|nr:GNAT family N-acetyltransferase [Gammaproteobacteria bacterium]
MLLFSTALMKHKLMFKQLSSCMECLPIAAKWTEEEWGYIRNKGVEFRQEVMNSLKENVYIGFFADQPVAMFALFNHSFPLELTIATENLPKACELMYVFVEKKYRGLGFGKQIIDQAKQLAANSGAELILLDTLKPNLNRLYEKHNAEVICEGSLFGHGTDVLRMRV